MNSKQILLFLQICRAKLQIKWEKVGVGEGKNECEMQVFSMLLRCVRLPCRYVFVIVANKKNEVHRGALRYPYFCFGEDYFFSQQAFSHSAALGQTFSQESAFSQVAQSMWQESAISQAALQQVSATHSV